MKKFLILILFLLLGCVETNPEERTGQTLKIYSMNDLHGVVISDNGGMSVIGSYLKEQKENDPNTIILTAGDMLQGTAISNMSQGAVVVEILNDIGIDAFTIGNHEFDWGIDALKSYLDGGDVIAEFPMIAANIYERATDKAVEWAKPYTIIDKGNYRVGVIGIIGDNLERSISPSIVSPFEFKDEFQTVKKYTKLLRTEKDVDIVIVSAHANTENHHLNYANLIGDYKIDAIIDGHTHSNYYGETYGAGGLLPHVQSGAYGSHIGLIEIHIDENNKVYDASATNIDVRSNISIPCSTISEIIDRYNQEALVISGEILGISGTTIDRAIGTNWAADVIRFEANTDIGLINLGGIRANAFPILNNQSVSVGLLWEMMPFDNLVITVDMQARHIVEVYNKTRIRLSGAEVSNNRLYVNGKSVDNHQVFSVATIDYLFDNQYYPFHLGANIVHTGDLFRDYLINNLRKECSDGSKWYAVINQS